MDEDASCSTFEKEENYLKFDESDFSLIVKKKTFVDKTLLIKTIFDNESAIMITAPARFGKSTNMDMLKKFVEFQVDKNGAVIDKGVSSNYQVFKDNDLLIFQDKDFFDEHFATYPVIHTSFKSVSGNSLEEVLVGFRTVLRECYLQHSYLMASKIWSKGPLNIKTFERYIDSEKSKALNTSEIETGFTFLSQCLYKHFGDKKVFVLIDDCDAPLHNMLFEKNYEVKFIKVVNSLLCAIFSDTLKENRFVERVLVTGISYFAIEGFTGANNVLKYKFLGFHPFVKYYGLTESEVDTLLSTFKIDGKKVDDIKSYYNGYHSKENVKLFSLSVLHYLQKKELKSYWQKSGIMHALNRALRFPSIQITIEKLLKNESKYIEIYNNIRLDDIVELQDFILGRTNEIMFNPDLFLSFFLQDGYLTYKGTENQVFRVEIPNNEIRDEFRRELNNYYGLCTNGLLDECSVAFDKISPLDIESFQKFVEAFQRVVHTVSDDMIKQNDCIFHSLLLCVISRAQFQICDVPIILPSVYKPDLIGVKDKNAFMFKLKFRLDCQQALQQMIEKKYYTEFDSEEFKDLEHKVYLAVNVSEDLSVGLAVLVNSLDINKAEYFPR